MDRGHWWWGSEDEGGGLPITYNNVYDTTKFSSYRRADLSTTFTSIVLKLALDYLLQIRVYIHNGARHGSFMRTQIQHLSHVKGAGAQQGRWSRLELTIEVASS